MGGYGSTRWSGERTREVTDPLLSLDARMLKRVGAARSRPVNRSPIKQCECSAPHERINGSSKDCSLFA